MLLVVLEDVAAESPQEAIEAQATLVDLLARLREPQSHTEFREAIIRILMEGL